MITLFAVPEIVHSQDISLLRASRRSFSSAKDNYKNGNYQKAIQEYQIVINTIPANIDSRGDLSNRLESLVDLIEIYSYKYVDLSKACEYIETFNNDMNIVRARGVLRASQLLDFQRKEQEYKADYLPKCDNYKKSGDDMNRFRETFEEEIEK